MLLCIIFHQLLLYSWNKPSVDICQSAAIWFCSFVVHIWCLTISSASACASQRTQQAICAGNHGKQIVTYSHPGCVA